MSGWNQLKRKRGKSGQVQTLWTLVVALTFAGVAIAQYVANTRPNTSLNTRPASSAASALVTPEALRKPSNLQ